MALAKRLQAALLVVLCTGALCRSVAADANLRTDDPRSEARRLFLRGVEAATNGLWEEARAEFSHSFELVPNASTLLNLAGCQVNTGQLVEARDNYRRVLDANTVTSVRAEEVASLIASLEARIPKLRLAGASSPDVLLVDGNAISLVGSESGVALNPGVHVVEVKRGSELLLRHEVQLVETEELVFDVARLCSRCVAASAPSEPAPGDEAETGSGRERTRALSASSAYALGEREPSASFAKPARVLPWVALGVGITGALTLAIAGPLALREERQLARGCGATETCSASDVQTADRLAWMADAGLAFAVTGVVTSALGFWLRPRAATRALRTEAKVSSRGMSLTTKVAF